MESESGNRERLLKSACKLFAEKGFEGASVRQICDDAGVNAALISYYFGGKENVFEELFRSVLPIEAIINSIAASESPVDGVRRVIEQVVRFRKNEPDLVKIIQMEVIKSTDRSLFIQERFFPIWDTLKRYLQEGKEQGLLHFRSLDTAFGLVISVVLYPNSKSYWERFFTIDGGGIDAFIEEITEFVLRGLCYTGVASS